MQRVIDRVAPPGDRLDPYQRVPVQPAHQARELAEASLRPGPPRREDLCFQDDLRAGDAWQVYGFALRELGRRAAYSPRDAHLVDPDRRPKAGTHDLEGMRADRDRNGKGTAALQRALREQAHVVGRHDVDARQVLFLDQEAIDAGIEAVLGIARHHDARRDHGPAIVDRGHRDRQREEIDVVAGLYHFLVQRGLDVAWRNRMVESMTQLVLDFPELAAPHRQRDSPLRAVEA
jgi:hypothetical protein